MKMSKSLSLVVLIVVLLSSSFAYGSGDQTSIVLNTLTDVSALKSGDIFEVEVKLVGLDEFVGGEIYVEFDSNLLRLTDNGKVILGEDLIDFTSLDNVDNDNLKDEEGNIAFIVGLSSGLEPISGDYVLGRLELEAIDVGSGSVSIEGESKLVKEDTDGNYSRMPFSSEGLSFSILEESSIAGDVNDDDIVDLADLVYVANYFGFDSDDAEWSTGAARADVNEDGRINVIDLIFVSRRME